MEREAKGGIAPDDRTIHEKAPILGACCISLQSQKAFDAFVEIVGSVTV